ncbi:hypothetical protein HY750_02390 [Candidatus Kuenenbacteria bacterium]|nr:hypothetical protein [Candidatus Kuenenbacteria bacterium]
MKFFFKKNFRCDDSALSTSIQINNILWLNNKTLEIKSCISLYYLNSLTKGDFEIQGNDLILKFDTKTKKILPGEAVCFSCMKHYEATYKFTGLEKNNITLKLKQKGESFINQK